MGAMLMFGRSTVTGPRENSGPAAAFNIVASAAPRIANAGISDAACKGKAIALPAPALAADLGVTIVAPDLGVTIVCCECAPYSRLAGEKRYSASRPLNSAGS